MLKLAFDRPVILASVSMLRIHHLGMFQHFLCNHSTHLRSLADAQPAHNLFESACVIDNGTSDSSDYPDVVGECINKEANITQNSMCTNTSLEMVSHNAGRQRWPSMSRVCERVNTFMRNEDNNHMTTTDNRVMIPRRWRRLVGDNGPIIQRQRQGRERSQRDVC